MPPGSLSTSCSWGLLGRRFGGGTIEVARPRLALANLAAAAAAAALRRRGMCGGGGVASVALPQGELHSTALPTHSELAHTRPRFLLGAAGLHLHFQPHQPASQEAAAPATATTAAEAMSRTRSVAGLCRRAATALGQRSPTPLPAATAGVSSRGSSKAAPRLGCLLSDTPPAGRGTRACATSPCRRRALLWRPQLPRLVPSPAAQ